MLIRASNAAWRPFTATQWDRCYGWAVAAVSSSVLDIDLSHISPSALAAADPQARAPASRAGGVGVSGVDGVGILAPAAPPPPSLAVAPAPEAAVDDASRTARYRAAPGYPPR